MLRILPFAVLALFAIGFSATGMEPIALGMGTGGAALLISIMAVFVPPNKNTSPRQRWAVRYAIGLFAALYVSVLATHWPLRVAFSVSQARLNAVTRTLRNGGTFHGPQRVGMFVIQQAETTNCYRGCVCLWTDSNPGSSTGFVEGPLEWGPDEPWSQIELAPKWCLLSQD